MYVLPCYHSESELVMSPTIDKTSQGSILPIWDGSSSDPSAWDNYRYAIQGCCAGKDLSALLRTTYDNVKSEGGETPDGELQDKLMGILLQTTRDVAGMVVRPFAEEGDGVGAWRALITRYGNDSGELRQARQIEYQKRLENVECSSRNDILDMTHMAEHIFCELDKLKCALPDSYKRNFIMLRIKDTAPEIYTSVAQNTEMSYHMTVVTVKKLAALNSAIDETAGRAGDLMSVFFTKTSKNGQIKRNPWKERWNPEQERCYGCHGLGHMVRNCPNKDKGEGPKVRPNKYQYKGRHILDEKDTQSFQSFCFVAEAQGTDRGWLVDSGCNRHMTPIREDLTNLQPSNIECTFGNNEKLKAEFCGQAQIDITQETGNKVKILLDDVLYVPGLPQKMLSTGKLCRAGGEFLQSSHRQSVLIMPDSKTRITLHKKGEFLWLIPDRRTHLESVTDSALSSTVYAPGDRDTASASLIDWHEALGHSHPASITFLEQGGLIKITGEKTLDNFNCRICREEKSTIPHYQKGTRSVKNNGEMVHVDLVGPFIPDMNGCTYLMVFIDEASRFKSVFGLKTKDEAYKQLKTYQEGMQLMGVTVECIRGDGAGELGRSVKFRKALTELSLK